MNKIAAAVVKELVPVSAVFATRDAAAAAAVDVDEASRHLSRLAALGIITRIASGIWADTRHPDFSPYAAVPYLLRARQSEIPGYVSLLTALNLRGMIDQIPRVIQIVVTAPRRTMRTPVATYEFHRIDEALFGGYEPFGQLGNFSVATPAKALFDVLYLSVRRGRRFSHLPELESVRDFREAELQSWIFRIPYTPLRIAVAKRWMALRPTLMKTPLTSTRRAALLNGAA